MNRVALLIALALSSLAAPVRADKILVASGGGNPVPFNNIKVTRVDGGKIYFRTQSGNETSRDFEQVVQMSIDDEPGFTAAEDAYAAKQWTPALDGYQKALRASDKPWLRDRSATRLIETSAKLNRLDGAITGYIHLVSFDPKAASKFRPVITDTSPGLDAAAAEAGKALQDSKLNDEKKAALLSLLLDIHRARKDNRAAGEVILQLTKLNIDLGSDPAAAKTLGDLNLSVAKLSLEQKKYDKAIADIEAKKSTFIDPGQQAEALFVLAEARNGLDGEPSDETTLKDIALAYMRVVAQGKDVKDSPVVIPSLFHTAEIMEKLKQPHEAMQLYQQVAQTDNPLAARAKEALDRLGKVK